MELLGMMGGSDANEGKITEGQEDEGVRCAKSHEVSNLDSPVVRYDDSHWVFGVIVWDAVHLWSAAVCVADLLLPAAGVGLPLVPHLVPFARLQP